MKKTDIYLTIQQLAALKELSANTGLSVAEHIRRAIDNYLQPRGDIHQAIDEHREKRVKK